MEQYLYLFFGTVCVFLLPLLVIKLILIPLGKTSNQSSFLKDFFIPKVKTPAILLIFSLLSYKYFLLFIDLSEDVYQLVISIFKITTIISIFWFFHRLISYFKNKAQNSKIKLDTGFIFVFLHILILIVSILIIADIVGFNINSLLTFGGIGGAAISFAARDTLSNIINAFTISIDKPFVEGEEINIKEKNIEGIVEKIGWRMVHIVTYEKFPVYIPNSMFSNLIVHNISRTSHRRFQQYIRISYKEANDLYIISDKLKELIKEKKYIDQKQAYIVSIDYIAKGVCELFIRVFMFFYNLRNFCECKENFMIDVNQLINNYATSIHKDIIMDSQIENIMNN